MYKNKCVRPGNDNITDPAQLKAPRGRGTEHQRPQDNKYTIKTKQIAPALQPRANDDNTRRADKQCTTA